MTHLSEGQPAPGFTAKDQNGDSHSLKEYRGRHVVLAFIPDDGDQEDAAECQGFAKLLQEFRAMNTEVIAIGNADQNQHKSLAKKASARYSIMTDKGASIAANYGCAKNGHALRNTFLIDPEGKVEKVYDSVFPNNHAKEVAHQLKMLGATADDAPKSAS